MLEILELVEVERVGSCVLHEGSRRVNGRIEGSIFIVGKRVDVA